MFPSQPIDVRFTDADDVTSEIKDPSIYFVPDDEGGHYEICISKGHVHCLPEAARRRPGDELAEQWVIGRMRAAAPEGPWIEMPPLTFEGLDRVEGCHVVTPEVCAPAVTCRLNEDGTRRYDLYVQSTCFQAGGAILHATSSDGAHYVYDRKPLVAIGDVPVEGAPLAGLYDVSVSDITLPNGLGGEEPCEYLTFSGYRQVGCGDIYGTKRRKADGPDAPWETALCILRQEEMSHLSGQPFHNQPGCEGYEWGIEGAKVIQLAKDRFVIVGVCFLTPEQGCSGTRQRTFMAAAACVDGPYAPMCLPFQPHALGENGHPDTIDLGGKVGVVYQQRLKNGNDDGRWHPCYGEIDKARLLELADKVLPPREMADVELPRVSFTGRYTRPPSKTEDFSISM